MATQAGCTSVRNEWSEKQGGPDIDGNVQTAVRRALPESQEVSAGSHKNGFAQEMDVDITLPNASFDADDLLATATAICETAILTDEVFIEVTDGSDHTPLDLSGLVTDHFPALDTPYDPTQVQIEVEEDCPNL